jgi:hypothetical protein
VLGAEFSSRGIDGLLPLLISYKFAVGQLAEVALNEPKLRIVAAPDIFPRLLDYAPIVLTDDFTWIGFTNCLRYAAIVRGDEKDARGYRQCNVSIGLAKT